MDILDNSSNKNASNLAEKPLSKAVTQETFLQKFLKKLRLNKKLRKI